MVAVAVAALFAGLCAACFAVSAGAAYPEPWTQLSD